jgi:cyclase
MKMNSRFFGICLFSLLVVTGVASAQNDFDAVQIGITEVTDHIYMLTGSGGNLGLSTGDDGGFLVDDQFAPLTGKIIAAIKTETDRPVHFVINTHWHADHTGGNEHMGEAGAVIVAHENVRKRMSADQFLAVFNSATPASPEEALPVVTFTESVTFHWNEDEIHVFHVAPAHTDGDSVVHFKDSNVIHAGDVYFNGMYPFFDTTTGGNLKGMILGAKRILAIANEDTKIIPGHGPLSGRAEFVQYVEMMEAADMAISAEINAGKSRDEVIAAKPTAALDEQWGGGFLNPDVFVGIVYDGMKAN